MLFANAAGSLFALASLVLSSQASLIHFSRDALPEALEHRYAKGEPRTPIAGRAPSAEDVSKFKATEASLDKRGPPRLFDDHELSVLRTLAEQLNGFIYASDCVIFLDSVIRLGYAFRDLRELGNPASAASAGSAGEGADDGPNLWALPISRLDLYKVDEKGTPTDAGLDKCWEDVLAPILNYKKFNRIVLVARTGIGPSVDGFRRAFVDLIRRASDTNKIDMAKSMDLLLTVDMVSVNVADWSLVLFSPEATRPEIVKTLATITDEGDSFGTALSEVKHPPVNPNYYPARWETPFQECWADGEEPMARAEKGIIRHYNELNGGLFVVRGPTDHPAEGTHRGEVEYGPA